MMSNSIYDIPMPTEQKELLLELVGQAQKYQVLSVHYSGHPDDNAIYHLTFYCVLEDRIARDWPENPVPGFEVLGLVKITGKSFVLTPQIFKWAAYQNKSKFGKWWVRLP